MHPIARCTIPVRMCPLPCRSVPVWMQSCYSAVPPRSEATRCTAVSPRLTAARRLNVPALYGHKLVALLYRFCSNILHCPAASLADHPLTSYPPVWVQPRFPAVQLHSDAHPTVPLCCCSQAAPVALHTETALLCRPCSNIPRCSSMPHGSRATPLPLPRLGTTSFSPLYGPLRMRPTAPLRRRCAEIRLLPDHILCSKAIPLPAVHPWPENPPPPRCAASAWRHSGAAAPLCPTYFPSQTTRTGRFSFSVRPLFLWKFIGTALSFFRMDNDSQAAG